MARPKKQTVDYFPHYCKHKKTMFIIEQNYGNDGYAFWFKLLELIGDTEGHCLDLNDEATFEYLQAKTRLSRETCSSILNLLAKLHAIDKKLWSEKIVWCQNFVDGVAPVYANRRVETPERPSFYKQKPRSGKVSTSRNPQSKVEETRVEESTSSTRAQFDDTSTNKIVSAFQKCIYPGITPFDIERLEAYLEDGLSADVIVFAIEEAANNNARRVAYITSILDRLRDAGITTREAAEADKASRQKSKNPVGEVAAPYHNRIVRAPRGDAASPHGDGSAVLPDKTPPRREDADSSRNAVSLENADFSPGQKLAEAWGD